MMRLNRSISACTTVLVVSSIGFFWLPGIFFVDLTHVIAGGLAGRLGGTTLRGVVAGLLGGFVVASIWFVGHLLLGPTSVVGVLSLLAIPVTTTAFGAIGGWTGKVV